MNVDFDQEKYQYNVTVKQDELELAFKSANDFQMLLHEITRKCYGEFIANLCFPINEVKR